MTMRHTPAFTHGRPAPAPRLREMPPFGEPDASYPPPPDPDAVTADDPRGVFLPAPEERRPD